MSQDPAQYYDPLTPKEPPKRQNIPFQLKAPYEPAGDQPEAIESVSQGLLDGKPHQTILGATGTGKTYTMASIVQKVQKPTLVIAHNKTLAAQLYNEFKEFFPENAVGYFVSYYDYYQPEAYLPASDTYIEKESTINDEIARFRHAATHNLLTRSDTLIVSSVSCIYGLGSVEDYLTLAITLKVGMTVKRDKLLRKLVDIQYSRSHLEFRQGMFHVMGDTLEIFPPSSERAVRLEFWGDELESLREIDPFTGEIFEPIEEMTFFPAKHDVTTPEKIERATKSIEEDLEKRHSELHTLGKPLEAHRIRQRTEYDMEMLKEVGYVSGIENYTRYLNGRGAGDPPATLLEYFPDDFLVFIDESHITVPQIGAMYEGNLSRKRQLIDYGFRLPSAVDNRPLQGKEFMELTPQKVYVSATPGNHEFKSCADMEKEEFYQAVEEAEAIGKHADLPSNFSQLVIRPTGLLDPVIEIRPTQYQVDDVLKEIQDRTQKQERVLITTLTKKSAENLTSYLTDMGVAVKYLHSDVDTMERIEILESLRQGEIDVIVGINLLREGLDLPEVSLVAIFDADKEGFLRSRDALIQTIGRAARNISGKAILYADKKTRAIEQALAETTRRRALQEAHNKEHGITPQTIKKAFKAMERMKEEVPTSEKESKKILPERMDDYIFELEQKMEIAAKDFNFELAAELRDEREVLLRQREKKQ